MLHQDLSIPYLLRPAKISNAKPEILILIHGYGSDQNDLFSFAQDLPDHFFVVSIQGLRICPYGGYAWYDINFNNAEKFTDSEQALVARDAIVQFIQEINQKLGLNTPVWLGGFSQGCILSYAIMAKYPKAIKRVVGMSGYCDSNILEFAPDPLEYEHINVFISHGEQDTVVPFEWGSKAPEILESHQVDHVFHSYNSGHGLNRLNYEDMLNWVQTH